MRSVFERVCDNVYLGGTTSNLRNHLDRAHPAEWSKVRTAISGKNDHSEGTKKHGAIDVYLKQMNVSSTRAGALTDAIVDFVALDLRPISVVNGFGFRRMLYKLEPGYRVPSRTLVASLLRKEKHVEGQVH